MDVLRTAQGVSQLNNNGSGIETTFRVLKNIMGPLRSRED
jgi:hypothetical protein